MKMMGSPKYTHSIPIYAECFRRPKTANYGSASAQKVA